MSDSGEYYRITCRFCDTILTVVEKQAGTEVKCPDCFSMLTVNLPAEAEKRRTKERSQSPAGSAGGKGKDEDFKLSDTFERPAVSPLFGLEASGEDMLAPRKRKPLDGGEESQAERPTEKTEQRSTRPVSRPRGNASSPAKSAKPANDAAPPPVSESKQDLGLDVDLPLPVDEVLSLDAIGKLDPDSELAPDSEPRGKTTKTSPDRVSSATTKQRSRKQPQAKSATTDEVEACRPKFRFANLFMATVGMLTDIKVLAASGLAVLVMLIGGMSSEIIFPVGSNTEALTMTASMYKYFISFLFGNLPYYFGLLGLWMTAGIVFQHAAQGHVKVQRWTTAGQSALWSSFLLFGFSFFIAGLPGAIFQVMIIPLRMLVAPLFLISAWFNFSPWQIVSTDWYHVVEDHKSQWKTVYCCFGGLAFAGLLTGGVFWARSSVDLVAVDLVLTFIAIVSNAVITLVFAAIAGWHTGAVIESLDQDG